MSPELVSAVEEATARLESWKGQRVCVEVMLAVGIGDAWESDRHGSTRSQFTLVVEIVGRRFSGNALMVLGSLEGQQCDHEIDVDRLVGVRQPDAVTIAFKEQFGRAAERVSIFRLRGAPEAPNSTCSGPAI